MKTARAGLIFGCAFIFNLMIASRAGALSVWEVATSKSTFFNTSNFCPTVRENVVVKGFVARQEMCQFGGDRPKVGSFFADGGESRLAASLPFDDEFRLVDGVCRGMAGCVYSPDQDLLVVRYHASALDPGVVVYKNVLQRLHLSLDRLFYAFDGSDPDYSLSDPSGQPLPIGAVGLSGNGHWLIAEVKDRGIVLINLETLEMRWVMHVGAYYGFGRDPAEELAVSNDGSHVAVMGDGVGFELINVTPTCGSSSDSCPIVASDTTAFISSFLFAAHPIFDESGKQLSFYAASRGQGSRRVVMRQSGYMPVRLSYLALGDSFTSGEGEVDDYFYKTGTNETFERCHLSKRSYPFLVGSYMGLSTGDTQNVACAGAKVTDVTLRGEPYVGQGQRLGAVGLQLSEFERSIAQAEALETFQPGRVYQEAFAERYQPVVITIGIGGNDAGLMGKLKTCAMPDLCEWAASPETRHRTWREMQRLFDRLQDLYRELLERTPESLLYVVGYPQMINPEGICGPVTSTLLTYAERVFMQESIHYLNQVIKAAAENVGLPYLDNENSLEGRQLCSPTLHSKAVNGLRLGDDVGISSSLPILKLIGSETFHPTPIGHELIAASIWEKYGDLRIPHTCQDCTRDQGPPAPSPYWTEGWSGSDDTPQSHVPFTQAEHISPLLPKLHLNLPAGSLEPGSTARIEIHSEPRMLAEATVHPDGSLAAEAEIPPDISEGFHSLHIYGTSYTQDPVDLYDIISYGTLSTTALTHGIAKTHVVRTVATTHSLPLERVKNSAVLGTSQLLSPKVKLDPAVEQFRKINLDLVVIILGAISVGIASLVVIIRKIIRQRQSNSTQDRGG